jgi:hypothetical protein
MDVNLAPAPHRPTVCVGTERTHATKGPYGQAGSLLSGHDRAADVGVHRMRVHVIGLSPRGEREDAWYGVHIERRVLSYGEPNGSAWWDRRRATW